MNGIYLGVLAVYLIHAVAMHRHHGPETGEETQLHRGMPAPLMPFALFVVYQGLSTPSVAALVLSPVTLAGGGILLLAVMLNQLRRKYREPDGGGALQRLFYVSGGMLQTVLLAMACYAAFHDGVLGRGLFDPVWVIMGLLAGHLIFGVSLLFSHRSLASVREIGVYVADVRPLCVHVAGTPRQLFACLDVSLIEELVYRVAAQGALLAVTGNAPASILITAVVFSMVHRHFFYNHVVDSVEFLAFSVLLGVLYFGTGSLVLVVLVHTVRNLEIVYLDQAAAPETAGHHRCYYLRGLISHAR